MAKSSKLAEPAELLAAGTDAQAPLPTPRWTT